MKTLRLSLAGVFLCLAVYLFVTAPPELADTSVQVSGGKTIEVEKMFNAVNAINDAARTIYTKRIVGPGKKAGLKFGEDWAEPGVEKGPLPALFLRLAAGQLEAKPPRLGLYLGSDEPINQSNLFSGAQAETFRAVKATRAPQFMQSEVSGFVAMYPDIAGAQPCVTCHNDHIDSPKKDWVLNDVMGATTWTYPVSTVAASDYLTTTDAFYQSVEEAYALYLDRAAKFDTPIVIGVDWPSPDNPVLPDLSTFMAEVRAAASERVVTELILTASAAAVEQIND